MTLSQQKAMCVMQANSAILELDIHLNSHCHQWPAFGANVTLFSASAYIIIICKINVKYELPF